MAAEEIIIKIGLDRVCIIPSNIPPHKQDDDLAASHHRYKMAKLTIADRDNFCISDYEISKNERCYTVDTLKHFKEKFPNDDLYFIVGNDIFDPIHTWKEYDRLFELANFIVICRPGYSEDLDELPLAIKDDFRYYKHKPGLKIYKHKSSNLLIKIQIKGLKVSSSEIRELVRNNKSIKDLVPSEVEQYISANNLYA